MKERYVELKSHADYLNLIDCLKQGTKYIQLVQIDNDENDPVIVKAHEVMKLVDRKKTNQWLGTKRGGSGVFQYTYIASEMFWKYLRSLDSFFINLTDNLGCDDVEITSFGYCDIAFLNSEKKPLFYTITHEGIAVEYVY